MRVQVIDNEIRIFEPDAPEVTGVYPKNDVISVYGYETSG